MSYNELDSFYNKLLDTDVSSDSEFHARLKESEIVLRLSDADLARELRLSRPTVNRWRSGKNAPHVFMREGILDWLKKRTRSLMRKAKAYESTGSGQGTPPTPMAAKGRY